MTIALQLDAGSYVQFANNASLEAATKMWGAFSISGATLNSLSGEAGVVPMDVVAKPGLSAIKGGLTWDGPSGFFGMYASNGTSISMPNQSGLNVGSYNSSLYYDCLWVLNDPANTGGVDGVFVVFAAGDLGGSVLGQWYRVTIGFPCSTAAGCGVRFLGFLPGSGLTGKAMTFDFAKIGDDNTYAFENAPLDEGTGTAVTPSGTINGTYTWLGATSVALTGTVTNPTTEADIVAGGRTIVLTLTGTTWIV